MMRQKTFELINQTGYFLQDEPDTDTETFDYVSPYYAENWAYIAYPRII